MNSQLFKTYMQAHGDTQLILADAMGLSESRLNCKINAKRGAEFRQREIAYIARRYNLVASEIVAIFFT